MASASAVSKFRGDPKETTESFAARLRRFGVSQCIPFRPVNGHTLRKFPFGASPESNLSLHRISSFTIITEEAEFVNNFKLEDS